MDSASRQINVGEALGRQLVDMVREVARRTLRGKLNKSELSNVEDDIGGYRKISQILPKNPKHYFYHASSIYWTKIA